VTFFVRFDCVGGWVSHHPEIWAIESFGQTIMGSPTSGPLTYMLSTIVNTVPSFSKPAKSTAASPVSLCEPVHGEVNNKNLFNGRLT
jgi:hypothetical protein